MQSLQNSHAVNINITKIFCAVVQASSSTSLFSRAIFPTPCRSMRTPHSRIAGRMRCHRCGWYISPPLSKRPLSNCLAWRIWCPEGHFWHIFLVLTNYTLIRRFFQQPLANPSLANDASRFSQQCGPLHQCSKVLLVKSPLKKSSA